MEKDTTSSVVNVCVFEFYNTGKYLHLPPVYSI